MLRLYLLKPWLLIAALHLSHGFIHQKNGSLCYFRSERKATLCNHAVRKEECCLASMSNLTIRVYNRKNTCEDTLNCEENNCCDYNHTFQEIQLSMDFLDRIKTIFNSSKCFKREKLLQKTLPQTEGVFFINVLYTCHGPSKTEQESFGTEQDHRQGRIGRGKAFAISIPVTVAVIALAVVVVCYMYLRRKPAYQGGNSSCAENSATIAPSCSIPPPPVNASPQYYRLQRKCDSGHYAEIPADTDSGDKAQPETGRDMQSTVNLKTLPKLRYPVHGYAAEAKNVDNGAYNRIGSDLAPTQGLEGNTYDVAGDPSTAYGHGPNNAKGHVGMYDSTLAPTRSKAADTYDVAGNPNVAPGYRPNNTKGHVGMYDSALAPTRAQAADTYDVAGNPNVAQGYIPNNAKGHVGMYDSTSAPTRAQAGDTYDVAVNPDVGHGYRPNNAKGHEGMYDSTSAPTRTRAQAEDTYDVAVNPDVAHGCTPNNAKGHVGAASQFGGVTPDGQEVTGLAIRVGAELNDDTADAENNYFVLEKQVYTAKLQMDMDVAGHTIDDSEGNKPKDDVGEVTEAGVSSQLGGVSRDGQEAIGQANRDEAEINDDHADVENNYFVLEKQVDNAKRQMEMDESQS